MSSAQEHDTLASIERLKSQLERAQRLASLGTITSAVFHEVNNFLTPVISYAQLALAEEPESELVRKALNKAILGSERAAAIASCMLGFAREAQEEPVVHLEHALNDTLICLGRDLSKDGIELIREIPPGVWVAVQPISMQQILMNLLINARRAINGKPGWIRIAAERSTWNDSGAEWAGMGGMVLTFEDSGPGMAPEIEQRAFEPFARGDEGEAGAGLGLAICRQLVEQSGGTIELINRPGNGCKFLMCLPIAHKPEPLSAS